MPFLAIDGRSGKVVDANPQALDMIGVTRQTPVSADRTGLQHLVQGPELRKQMAAHIGTITPEHPTGVSTVKGVDGKMYQLTTIASFDAGGKPLHYETVATDITGAVVQLEERAVTATETALILAHDLRGNFTTARGYAQMLQAAENLPRAEAVEWLERIVRTSDSGTELAQEYLDFMHAMNEKVIVSPVDMKSVIKNIEMSLGQFRRQKQCEIVLPTETPNLVARSEIVQMVLMNYVSNAVKYGGEHPHIQVRAEAVDGGKRVKYIVQDDGVAISPDDQKKLFLKFGRLKRHSEGGAKGTGLGLASVKMNIERCGGEVGVESEEGKGNAFFFILPAAELPKAEVHA